MAIAPINMPQAPMLDQLAKTELTKTAQTNDATQTTPVNSEDLASSFGKALSDARELDHKATDAAEKFAAGDPSMGIHEVMIATEKANIAVRYATTLKNKALEAYRELMNTQV
jgi:flagellar hook-basal body complex protein FliE